jgi:hypothetical protein
MHRIALLLGLLSATASGDSASGTRCWDPAVWEEVKGNDLEAGINDPLFPAKRYGAVMAYDRGSIVIAGGYLFDRANMRAVWLPGDFWLGPVNTDASGTTTSDFLWSQFCSFGVMEHDARYKAASAIVHPHPKLRLLILFGGGAVDGFAMSGKMVALNLATGESYRASSSAAPSPRISAGMIAVRNDAVILYGGLGRGGSLDPAAYMGVFTINPVTLYLECRWTPIVTAGLAPSARRAAVMCAWDRKRNDGTSSVSVIVFGGFGTARTNMNDLWLLENTLSERSPWAWYALHDGKRSFSTGSASPQPRGGAVGVVYGDQLFIAMGATCGTTCTTLSDVWVFELHKRRWRRIMPAHLGVTSPWPMSRQFAAASFAPPHWLYVFGGESFEPHAYWNDLWRLRLDTSNCTLEIDGGRLAVTPPPEVQRGREEWNPPIRGPIDGGVCTHRSMAAARMLAGPGGRLDADAVLLIVASLLVATVVCVKCSRRRRR